MIDSIIRVFEVGQRIIVDRIDLARFDLGQIGARVVRGAAMIAAGAVLLAGAWFVLLAGGVMWLEHYMSLPPAWQSGRW